MEEENQNNGIDMFVANSIYPEASAIFSHCPKPIQEIKDNCLVVLDTNALLVPYDTGQASLDQIKNIYVELVNGRRLFVPGQISREFAKNRATKLAEQYQRLSRAKNVWVPAEHSPLLESIEEYQNVVQLTNKLQDTLTEYRKAVSELLEYIKSWHWNDPVSVLYKDVFSEKVVFDLSFDEEQVKTELDRRYKNHIPPGYKDSSKKDSGVGDLLIWLSILEIGKKYKKDMIFVSGDAKADWQYRSEKQALYPRHELVDEYRRNSDNHSFYILNFPEFLDLFGVAQQVIDEVIETEKRRFVKLSKYISGPHFVELAAHRWIKNNYPNKFVSTQPLDVPFDLIIEDPQNEQENIGVTLKYWTNEMELEQIKLLISNAEEQIGKGNTCAVINFIATDSRDLAIKFSEKVKNLFYDSKIAFLIGYLTDSEKFVIVYFI